MNSSLPLDDKTLKAYEAYLCLQKNRSPHTVRAYLQTIRALADFAAAVADNDATTLIKDFTRDSFSSTAKSSQAQRASAIRTFIRWVPSLTTHTRAALLRTIQSPKIPKRIPRILELADIEKILVYMHDQQTEEQIVFYLLYGSGLRISEALGALWRNVNLAAATGGSIKVMGKGSKERIVPMVPALVKLLNKLAPLSSREDTLLTNSVNEFTIRKWVKRWGKELQLEDKSGTWHPHKLRHSIASHLLQMGAKVPQIQKLLGHENLATTEKYTHLNPSDLLKVYKKAMPLP